MSEEKGLIRLMAVLERVEAQRCESAKVVLVIIQETKCVIGHPIS